MQFNTHILPSILAEHVESIFHYVGYTPDHSIQRVVPTGHIFIIFELDGIERHTYDNASSKITNSFTKVWVSGMHRNHLSISAHPDSEMLVIQFKIGGAFPFFDIPIFQMTEKVIAGEEVFGNEILRVRDSLLIDSDYQEKFERIEKWLISLYNPDKFIHPDVVEFVSHMQKQPFNQHQELVANYPKTQKHLIEQFKKTIGLTPKVLHRIIRFNEVLQKIQHRESLAWSDLAYQFEYADQSHFIKEFKEFSGFSPEEYIEAEHQKGEPNFFAID